MKIKLKKAKTVKKMFRGIELEIEPYIPLEYKEFILQKAYESYLVRLEESGGLIEAIAGVDADIQMTIIGLAVKDVEFKEDTTYNDLLTSGFLYCVLDEIVNYQDIRNSAHDLIRLFVISERIPDISEMSKSLPDSLKNMNKDDLEMMTETLKEI